MLLYYSYVYLVNLTASSGDSSSSDLKKFLEGKLDEFSREMSVLKGKLNSMEKTSNSRFDSIEMTQLQNSESFAEVTSGIGRNIEKLAAEFIRLNLKSKGINDAATVSITKSYQKACFRAILSTKIPTWSQHLGLEQEF